MTNRTQLLVAELLELPASDRAEAAAAMLASLDHGPPDPEAEAAWLALAERRASELDAGTVGALPAREVLSSVRAAVRRG